MVLKAVDVYSGSPRSYATEPNADILIVKATQGTGYINPYCDTDYQAAKKAGKLLGVYHYAGGGDPVAEAKYFLTNVKGYLKEAVLILDWESNQNAAWGNTTWARRFVDYVHQQTGAWPLIYVQFSDIWQVANCANDCGLWAAGYPWYTDTWTVPPYLSSYKTAPWQSLTGWQFTGAGMDRSLFYVDAKGWRALAQGDGAKVNDQPTPDQQATPKPDVPAKPVNRWTDELGVTWTAENGTFTVGSGNQLHLRWGATPNSSVIAVLHAGDVVNYDAFARTNGFVYVRQPRGNGQYAYVAVRNAYTNEAYGTFK